MLLSKVEPYYNKLLRCGKQAQNRAFTLTKPGVADFVSSGPNRALFLKSAGAKMRIN